MNRRQFLIYSGCSATLAGANWLGFEHWQEITPELHYPGMQIGHFLRHWHERLDPVQQQAVIEQAPTIQTDVAVLGSGIAGLSAAWHLQKSGLSDFVLLEGPTPFGNAAGGEFQLAGEHYPYPKGAHYLPLPSLDAHHVREILYDLGVITANPYAERPRYDERYLLHAPHERVFYQGKWWEGSYPEAALSTADHQQFKRFLNETQQLSHRYGRDGKRLFTIPSALSSTDPEWRRLDFMYFSDWLKQQQYTSPALLAYLNYCCRDDYGRNIQQVSAWAGLHYFSARGGRAQNASDDAWLTWENGLQFLATGLANRVQKQRKTGAVLRVEELPDQTVRAFCVDIQLGIPHYFKIIAHKAICAFPLHIASKVVPLLQQNWPNLAQHLPEHAPWLVANYLLDSFPSEHQGAALAWDNIVYDSPGLGFVVSTHQQIRRAQSLGGVLTCYRDLADLTPQQARQWFLTASPQALLNSASLDLKTAYGWYLRRHTQRVELTLHGHAMAFPKPNTLHNPLLQQLRQQNGNILFAHADLSGISLFEEASWWGVQAAKACL